MDTRLPNDPQFIKNYTKHCKHLKLNGLQPKTIEAYSRSIRRIGNYFDCQLNDFTMDQLLDYFNDLLESHSWNTVSWRRVAAKAVWAALGSIAVSTRRYASFTRLARDLLARSLADRVSEKTAS